MHRKATWLLAVAMAATPASCDDGPPDVARVIVEPSTAAPVTLIVSTNFLVRVDEETNRREAIPLKADTVQLTGSYDQPYDIARFRRIYVLVQNEQPTPHRVRLRVLLGGRKDYNAFDDIGNGKTLEYLFVSTSSF